MEGRELYVTIMGNGKRADVLPPVELVFDKDKTRPDERIATQSAKWDEGFRERKGIKNVLARPVSRVAQARLEKAVRTAYRVFWMRDYARIDVRLDSNDEVWVLEANANPFLSFGHEVAVSSEKAGIGWPDYFDRIVKIAMKRYRAGHTRAA